VRHCIVKSAAVLVLALCFGGQVSELFDHWDKTLQTGTDVDYSIAMIAAVAGTVLVVAHFASTLRPISSVTLSCRRLSGGRITGAPTLICHIFQSPPAVLRV
jgi:hypothetical protein